MGYKMMLFLLVLSLSPARSQNMNEDQYSGEFLFGNFSTDLIIDIDRQNGSDQVFFSSPQQNAFRIPAREIVMNTDSIEFVLQSDSYKYVFKGSIRGDSLDLNLTIDNAVFPFTLLKKTKIDRKQVKSRDIRFRSGNMLLYGTVYFPVKPNGKAIYLVTSSGNQDRSASRDEAQFFARQGYITLHTDKRGTGLSDGNWHDASIPDLCADDIKAITYLAETNSLNYNNIGLKGSSQGASKIPYILSKMPQLGFGIVVSCPASTLLESDLNYWKNRTRNKLSEGDLIKAEKIQRSVFLYISGELSEEELEAQIKSVRNESFMNYVWVPDLDSVQTDLKLSYTPVPYFKQLKQPLLVIQGSADEIIPSQSLKKIQSLTENENPRNRYLELQKADHAMMFNGQSDFPYWPGLHPDYRNEMIEWLKQLELSGK
jgi:fermentation-respiration switch protein FrsA (DUF1100 family)